MKINQHFFFILLLILSVFVSCQSNDKQGGLSFDHERQSPPLTLEIDYLKMGSHYLAPKAFFFRTTFKNLSPDTVCFTVMSCSYGSHFKVAPSDTFKVVADVCFSNIALKIKLGPNETYENALPICLKEGMKGLNDQKVKIAYQYTEGDCYGDLSFPDSNAVKIWSNEVIFNPNNDFNWDTLKSHFPQKNITTFDFKPDRTPINQVEGLPHLDSAFSKHLMSQVEYYQNWKPYVELYYFSLNEFADAENEVGIFLATIDFDGLRYNFDLIQFDANGAVITYKTLATSWTAAECFGYTRAFIDSGTLMLTQQKVQKCFDESVDGFEVQDSSVTKTKLALP